MRNETDSEPNEESVGMRAEYDFSGGVRGKHAERYARGTDVVNLDADGAEVFGDAESANRAPGIGGDHPEQQAQKPGA